MADLSERDSIRKLRKTNRVIINQVYLTTVLFLLYYLSRHDGKLKKCLPAHF